MLQDAQGLRISAASSEAVRAYDHAVDGYVRFRVDTNERLTSLLETDPEAGMAHALKGYLAMLALNGAFVPTARAALADARNHIAGGTRRERAHVEALAQWIEGDLEGTLTTWERILEEHPRDLLAFRLHQNNAFWLGHPER